VSKEKLMERYSRFGLDEIYGQYKENRARLNQLEVEDSLGYYYELDEVYHKRRSNIRMLYEQNSMLWKEYQKMYINGFMEIFQMIFFHNNMAVIVS
jgi:hypothetical protein